VSIFLFLILHISLYVFIDPLFFTAEYREDATLLCSGLSQLFLHQSRLFVAGDFNLQDIDWKFCMFPIDRVQDILFDLFTNNILKQMNYQPTRLNNIPYILLTNICSVVTDCNAHDKLGASNHETYIVDILLPLVSQSIHVTVKCKFIVWTHTAIISTDYDFSL